MRLAMRSGLIVVLLAFASGCCLRFSDLPAGARYKVGDVISTSGTKIVVEKFQRADNQWTDQGEAKVDTRSFAKGSGQDLNAGNVNLHFRFNYPLKRVSVRFGELGGNNNIQVNTVFKNVANLVDLNSSVIGGVRVTVNASQQGANWYGTLQLDGAISDFLIGGQELWLDDVCSKK
jgi:hypothetical protein